MISCIVLEFCFKSTQSCRFSPLKKIGTFAWKN
jgi:hypothetical protein